MKMTFRNFQIIVDNDWPNEQIFRDMCDKGLSNFATGDIMYEFHQKFDEALKCYWIYAAYDNQNTYVPEVWNKETEQKEPNPKGKTQIELRQQLFGLYSIKTRTFYLSNLNKKALLEQYMRHTLQKDVYIKNVYTSIEEFQNSLKTLKEISFISKNILCRESTGIFDSVCNAYGLNYADKFYLKVDYQNLDMAVVQDNDKGFLKNIFSRGNKGEIEDILVVGYDDAGLESRFCIESVIKNISIIVDKNENGMYDEDAVRRAILLEIR